MAVQVSGNLGDYRDKFIELFGVLLYRYTADNRASAHSRLGSLDSNNKALILSNKVRFILSTPPFASGLNGGVNLKINPLSLARSNRSFVFNSLSACISLSLLLSCTSSLVINSFIGCTSSALVLSSSTSRYFVL